MAPRNRHAGTDQRRISRHHVRPPTGSEARMHSGSIRATGGADVREERNGGVEAIPMPSMHILYSLRAEHYARQCESHGRLCALIAAHAHTGIGLVAWKRTDAAQSVVSEAETPGMQDAIAANYAMTRAQGRAARTRRPDEG